MNETQKIPIKYISSEIVYQTDEYAKAYPYLFTVLDKEAAAAALGSLATSIDVVGNRRITAFLIARDCGLPTTRLDMHNASFIAYQSDEDEIKKIQQSGLSDVNAAKLYLFLKSKPFSFFAKDVLKQERWKLHHDFLRFIDTDRADSMSMDISYVRLFLEDPKYNILKSELLSLVNRLEKEGKVFFRSIPFIGKDDEPQGSTIGVYFPPSQTST